MIRQALVPRPAGAREPATRRTIPFDYAFRFALDGIRDRVLNQTVTVSVEATFVAVAIGYGVAPSTTPITFAALPKSRGGLLLTAGGGALPALRELSLQAVIDGLEAALPNTSRLLRTTLVEEALTIGIRLNPEVAALALRQDGGRPLEENVLGRLFQLVAPPPELVQFKYALFDEASGREFQSEPILSTAGLGIANGDRPFRLFAQPITFAPLTAIRMQVTELSGFKGELHVALHGYKVLGGAGTPTGRSRR